MEETERRLQAGLVLGAQLTIHPSGTWKISICSPGVWRRPRLLGLLWGRPSSASWGDSSRGFLMETGAVGKYLV